MSAQKREAGAPERTAPRELFVRRVSEEVRRSGLERQVTIQSFDRGALREMHRLVPCWSLVALTNYDFLQVGLPGPRPDGRPRHAPVAGVPVTLTG